MKLTKKIIKQIENKTSCGVSDNGNHYSIYVDNSCGEDFSFDINKGKDELEDIIRYCDDFDVDEHFKLWYGANNGEPSDVRTLLENCEEIKEHLQELWALLEDIMYS